MDEMMVDISVVSSAEQCEQVPSEHEPVLTSTQMATVLDNQDTDTQAHDTSTDLSSQPEVDTFLNAPPTINSNPSNESDDPVVEINILINDDQQNNELPPPAMNESTHLCPDQSSESSPPLESCHPVGGSSPPLEQWHPVGESSPPLESCHPVGESSPPLEQWHPVGESSPPLEQWHPVGGRSPPLEQYRPATSESSPPLEPCHPVGENSPPLEQWHPVNDDTPSNMNTDECEGTESGGKSFVLGSDPVLLTGSWKEFKGNNFLRGCKWSPDGTCLLTCSDDDVMRLYNLPTELYQSGATEKLPEITPVLRVPHASGIYDYCWYPSMSSWEPTTCCFATSCKDQPIHMWDAFYGSKRASYVPYNHLDEVISPCSLAFSLDGERLYAGFNKSIKVFHTSRPGRTCTSRSTYDKKKGGQPGLISCIAMHPTQPGTFALGSYSCSVALYTDSTKSPIFTFTDLGSGVTHMQFTKDGHKLLVGYRKSNFISCWDLRNPVTECVSMEREVDTNQRVYFDQTR
ncbi:telomerase Cajal body protein 1-like isoform X3 [Halichondria panicea]|uniref:telomerase Cajal body protein 1-like isoform X3 n=1 Tax=Halichondria panicea TaxID=6063 RepID=UPI00312B61FF